MSKVKVTDLNSNKAIQDPARGQRSRSQTVKETVIQSLARCQRSRPQTVTVKKTHIVSSQMSKVNVTDCNSDKAIHDPARCQRSRLQTVTVTKPYSVQLEVKRQGHRL